MKLTMWSALASLVAAGVLVGGCMAGSPEDSDVEGIGAEEPGAAGGDEEVGEAQQALCSPAFPSGFIGQMSYGSIFSPDCRFVLEHEDHFHGQNGAWGFVKLKYVPTGRVMWTGGGTGTLGTNAVMQSDGNFVIYDNATGVAIWTSGTGGNPGAKLYVQNDGNLVIVNNNVALWSTGTWCGGVHSGGQLTSGQSATSCDGRFTLTQQSDGNLRLSKGGATMWQNGSSVAGTRAVMQGDGNFVLYSPSDTPLWNTGTYNNPGVSLSLQDDGNMVIYSGSTPLWQSGTAENMSQCYMFKGTNLNNAIDYYETCAYSGSWVSSNFPGYSHYQEPLVNGVRVWNGTWASTNNYAVTATSSQAARNSFVSGASRVFGTCSACLQ